MACVESSSELTSCWNASRPTVLNSSKIEFPFFALSMSFSATTFRLSWSPPWGTPAKISSSKTSRVASLHSRALITSKTCPGSSNACTTALACLKRRRAKPRLSIQRRFGLAHTLVLETAARKPLAFSLPGTAREPIATRPRTVGGFSQNLL